MLHPEREELTGKIIGCAYKVYNSMGFGFLESVYEACMIIELKKLGIEVSSQYPISVHYDGIVVGRFFADLSLNGSVIVELKSVRTLTKTHEIQLVHYLKAINMDVGILINFGEEKVDVKRKVRVLPRND